MCGCVGGVAITVAVGLGLLANICFYELSQLPVCIARTLSYTRSHNLDCGMFGVCRYCCMYVRIDCSEIGSDVFAIFGAVYLCIHIS